MLDRFRNKADLFIYLFSVDGKRSRNRLCDMNTRQKRQENEQKKKFILYCTKFKELDLASAHVSVSLNLSGIHENSILMRLQLICEIT